MAESDRAMADRIHALIKASAPDLSPRVWYVMPAYARDGNVVFHFQEAGKFKSRYATLGFSDKAQLDEGLMWPVAFALYAVDRRRRGEDRRNGQESRELTTEPASGWRSSTRGEARLQVRDAAVQAVNDVGGPPTPRSGRPRSRSRGPGRRYDFRTGLVAARRIGSPGSKATQVGISSEVLLLGRRCSLVIDPSFQWR
jgi:uncharacterized protein YdhG (YjbR/CyaY superfamily)